MKIKIANIALLIGSISVADIATANQVQIFTNKPMQVTYRIARQNANGQPEVDPPQTTTISNGLTLDVDNKGKELSGVELLAMDGHTLPDSIHRFNQAKQCSMTTDQTRPAGVLKLVASEHSIGCETIGGVYGE